MFNESWHISLSLSLSLSPLSLSFISLFLSLSLSLSIYIYIYICVCISTHPLIRPSEMRIWIDVCWQTIQIFTYRGRVMHICVSNLTIIGSDNGLSSGRRQAIIWTNAGILLIGPLGTNFGAILIEIETFSFRKMHMNMSSVKRRPFCLGRNVLRILWPGEDSNPGVSGNHSPIPAHKLTELSSFRLKSWTWQPSYDEEAFINDNWRHCYHWYPWLWRFTCLILSFQFLGGFICRS